MSILDSRSLRCPRCGTELQATLLDTADASRLPALREAVLDGTLNRADCRACGAALRIDRRLLYLDRDRGAALLALPERSRAKPEREVQHVADVLALLPSAHADAALAMPHVVRGSGGLREALVAADAALPTARLDALKALLRAAHPTLARRPSLQLRLESADAGDLRFGAVDGRGRARYRIDLPGAAAPDALDEIDAIVAAAVAARTPTSWTARLAAACRRAWPWPVEPATPADPLHALRHHADAARDGRRVRFAGAAFRAMLDRLPRGEALPPWARGDLHVLFDLAHATGADEAVQDRLFEVRFGKALDDAFSRNDHPSDIARLWDVMSGLPAPHVESNRHLQEIRLVPGRAESWYEGNSIHLSARLLGTRPEAFDSAVRHEVGHAVHRKLDRAQGGIVSDWLADAFGWMEHRAGDDEEDGSADNWLALLVPDWPALPHARRAMVRGAVRAALGPGQRWSPPAPPDLPAEHPWHADGFGPRLAFERTDARWYRSTQTWLRSGGRAFFYNFYYGRLMAVAERTLDMIDDCLPSRYAAMSPAEFFAEVYAAYFDPHPDGRARLPADVRDWMAAHVAGAPLPGPARWQDRAHPAGDG